jgi:hypothetical protein
VKQILFTSIAVVVCATALSAQSIPHDERIKVQSESVRGSHNGWSVLTQYSPWTGRPLATNNQGQPYFQFASDDIARVDWDEYLWEPSPVTDLTGTMLTATWQITTTGTPTFEFYDHTGQCNNNTTAHIYFHAVNADNWTQGTYRWWYDGWAIDPLAPGTYSVTAPLDPSMWSDVWGQSGLDHPAAWAKALKNPKLVGMTFGGGCNYGHGVSVKGGTATFTVISIAIQ